MQVYHTFYKLVATAGPRTTIKKKKKKTSKRETKALTFPKITQLPVAMLLPHCRMSGASLKPEHLPKEK